MRRTWSASVAAAVAVIGLSACSAQATPTAAGVPASGSPGGSGTAAAAVQADPGIEHVHTITLAGDTLLLGTHEGLWRQRPGQAPERLSEPFDVMGFAAAPRRYLASGHPGAEQDLPPDLGLQESLDGGRTWTTVSLQGEVDFHRLVASGRTVVGLGSGDGTLRRSADGGKTWTVMGQPPFFDIALDPEDPDRVIATTQDGPVLSTDAADNFTPVKGAPVVALLAWSGSTLYGVAPDGTVQVSTDRGTTWTQKGRVGAGQPSAIGADGDRVAVLAGNTIVESTDGGATFTDRITDLAGH